MKRVFCFVLIAFFVISFTSAQLGGIENRIDDTRDNVGGNITAVRDFTERDRWNFIGSQWKEFLLKNKVIAGVDAFFTKISVVFVILFAKSWELSIEMLFVFMLWLFTVFSLYGYFFFFKTKGIRWIGSILGSIALAQARVFYFISAGMYKLVFLKNGYWWNFLTFIVCIGLIVLYLKVNKVISKQLEKSRKKRDEHEKDVEFKEVKAFQKGMIQGQG